MLSRTVPLTSWKKVDWLLLRSRNSLTWDGSRYLQTTLAWATQFVSDVPSAKSWYWAPKRTSALVLAVRSPRRPAQPKCESESRSDSLDRS